MGKSPSNPKRYFKELRFQQLRALLAVNQHQSFAGAAAALGLSTPSVWQQVRGLEAEFGAELVRVEKKSILLTDDALALVDVMRPVVEGFDSLHDIFDRRKQAIPERLILTSTNQLLRYELRKPLAEYRRQHPDTQLSIIDLHSKAARDRLKRGEADIAVVGELAIAPELALKSKRLAAYPFVLIAPQGHPQLTSAQVSIRALAKLPLVLSTRETKPDSRVNTVFRKAGVVSELNIVVDSTSIDLLIDLVSRGFGVSIATISPMLLREAQQKYQDQLGFRDLSRQFGVESIVLLYRASRFEPAHQRSFRTIIEECVK